MGRRRSPLDASNLSEMYRDLRADYDAARQTRFKRRRQGVVATGSGADYHYRTESAYFGAMETARDLFRNHMLIGQGVRRLVANVLRGGFTLDVQTGDTAINADLKARWTEWAEDPALCDLAGEHDFHTLERLVLQETIVDGDRLTLPTRYGAIQAVEAHRLRTPRSTTRNVIHGVLLDEYRRRVEYWVTKEDIQAMAPVARVKDIRRYSTRDADGHRQVLHHYMPDRTSQTRGVTAFVPAIDTAGMGDDLMFAQLVKAQMAACVTLFRELANEAQIGTPGEGQETSSETRPDGTTRTLAGWQPGMEIFGFPGEKLQGFAPNIPNPEFFQHAMLILSIIAVNLDLPVHVLLLDPSRTNFSGWRGAMDQARERFRQIQDWLIKTFHRPVYLWKVRGWIAEDTALAQALGKSGLNPYGHRWQAAGWPYIEPVKDATDHLIRSRNAQTSRRRLSAEVGEDWEDVSAEICADNALLIRRAAETAAQLQNDLGIDVTWRDVASLPTAEGIKISVGGQSGAQEGDLS